MSMTRTSLLALLTFFVSVFIAACDNPPAQPSAPAAYPDADSPGARLLLTHCKHCHAPPYPSVHKADEWSSVIYRMKGHMLKLGLDRPDESESRTLLEYLSAHARDGS